MARKNLSKALDFSRAVLPLNDLVPTSNVTQDDIFLVLDTNEIQALAQPKQVSLGGVSTSLATLPSFQQNISGIVQDTLRQVNHAYGTFYDTSDQISSGITTTTYMRCNNAELTSDGVTVVSGTRFIMPISGIYNLQFSAQFEKSDAGNDSVDVWFVKNNTSVPWSNSRFTITGNNGQGIAAWNYMLTLAQGDNIQIAWVPATASIKIAAHSGLVNPTRASIPSVIVTFDQVA